VYTVERYRDSRFWALYDGGDLVCVTVYKKGANAVKERLERLGGLPPSFKKAAQNADIDGRKTCSFLHICRRAARFRR
jgi:hypothetical protein